MKFSIAVMLIVLGASSAFAQVPECPMLEKGEGMVQLVRGDDGNCSVPTEPRPSISYDPREKYGELWGWEILGSEDEHWFDGEPRQSVEEVELHWNKCAEDPDSCRPKSE